MFTKTSVKEVCHYIHITRQFYKKVTPFLLLN